MIETEELPLCACGCGNRVSRKGNTFINGHNRRKEDYYESKIRKLCKCGCGEYANPGCDYINGHQRRGKKMSQSVIDSGLIARRKRFEDPKEREKVGKERRQYYIDHPEARLTAAEKTTEQYSTQTARNEQSDRIRNSEAMKIAIENMKGGNDIVKHHYIYDHNDLSEYTMKMTRSQHTSLHNLMKKVGIKIHHINVDGDIK